MLAIEAEKLAKELMIRHNLNGWSFSFEDTRVRFGSCNYTKKQITLSIYLVGLNSFDEVKETILHEIAHALAGYKAAHGLLWKFFALKIGASPKACYGLEVKSARVGSKSALDFYRKYSV